MLDSMIAQENQRLGATRFLNSLLDRLSESLDAETVQDVRIVGISMLAAEALKNPETLIALQNQVAAKAMGII